jgi:omega-amidase
MKKTELQVYQFQTIDNYEANFETLLGLYHHDLRPGIALAPEVCLSGFDYDNMKEASEFSKYATQHLCSIVTDKALGVTMIEKEGDEYYNVAKLFYEGKVIYQQKKAKLFLLGDEDKHFGAGKCEDIQVVAFNGIKIAFLVCFELRFPQLWLQVAEADIIMVPAMWGANRSEHYRCLTQALAITSRSYVMASDSSNKNMGKESGIITPFGVELRNNTAQIIEMNFDQKEILKMKRFIPYA